MTCSSRVDEEAVLETLMEGGGHACMRVGHDDEDEYRKAKKGA